MTPYEILLSESQERMLVVARRDRVEPVLAIAAKWELEATPIGQVTDDGRFRVRHGDIVVAEIPGKPLVDDCPVYAPEAREAREAEARRVRTPTRADPSLSDALHALAAAPALASKRWVYEQYDSTVRAGTVLGPGGDAAVIVIPETTRGVAVATDGNGRYVLLDPYEGGKAAVAEAARNVACTGARPIGITNCLNFGNPERPEIFFQFREACRGMAEACRALNAPVTGGNVSFYNESPRGAVDPTPVVGMVGLVADVRRVVPAHFAEEGDVVALLGTTRGHLGASAYWAHVLHEVAGPPPPVDLAAERRLVDLLVALANEGLVRSAHDVSDGGLGLALIEAAMGGPYARHARGGRVDLRALAPSASPQAVLFGEDQARALVSLAPAHRAAAAARATEHGVAWHELGRVGTPGAPLEIEVGGEMVRVEMERLRSAYFDAIPARMHLAAIAEA